MMLDWVVWVFTFTILLLILLWLLKVALDYPGILNWKCVYKEPSPDKIEIDLSEYELAAIDIPDRSPTQMDEKKVDDLPADDVNTSDHHSVVTSVGTSLSSDTSSAKLVAIRVTRETEVTAKGTHDKLFQDKIIVLNEQAARQC